MSEPVKLIAEGFARRLTRRRFISTTLTTAFFSVAYFALDGLTSAHPALGASCFNQYTTSTVCNPPSAGYCSSYSSSYCSNGDCAGGCTPSGCHFWFESANCWCTDVSCSPRGYYICCDCTCAAVGGPSCCACSKFVATAFCR